MCLINLLIKLVFIIKITDWIKRSLYNLLVYNNILSRHPISFKFLDSILEVNYLVQAGGCVTRLRSKLQRDPTTLLYSSKTFPNQQTSTGTFNLRKLNIAKLFLDQCEPDPCGSNEVCRRHDASYKCECEKGWSGDNCSTNTDDCLNNGCQNGARCLDMLGDYTCVCKWGFHGRYCELNIDECKQEKDLCRNGATCKDGPNNFNCICTKGWVGRFCQDVDPNLSTTPSSTVPTPVPDVPNPTETTVKTEEPTGKPIMYFISLPYYWYGHYTTGFNKI